MSVAQQNLAGQIRYDDLYQRWEDGNWKASEIDFSKDRAGWEALTDIQRRSALWLYSMFLYGRTRSRTASPYIDAAPKEEQKYFLATQQVDEARHAVFFHRFFKEVIGAGDSITRPSHRPILSSAGAIAASSAGSRRCATSFGRTARCRTSPGRSRSTT